MADQGASAASSDASGSGATGGKQQRNRSGKNSSSSSSKRGGSGPDKTSKFRPVAEEFVPSGDTGAGAAAKAHSRSSSSGNKRGAGGPRGRGRGHRSKRGGRGASTSNADNTMNGGSVESDTNIPSGRSSNGRGRGRGRGRGERGGHNAERVAAGTSNPDTAEHVHRNGKPSRHRGGNKSKGQVSRVLTVDEVDSRGDGGAVASATAQYTEQSKSKRPLQSRQTTSNQPLHNNDISKELNEESYECLVCTEYVRRKDPIWHCQHCYRILHLGCLKRWRSKCGAKKAIGPLAVPDL
eukprot:gb/GECG01013211.1/.p1 GENE.gb/GECG01013211.1/~~gb/GECG01013211.1/.p1  ORF type:complete len:295 (+),score=38.87 gb/GECG01013211.1/:1-885(+)